MGDRAVRVLEAGCDLIIMSGTVSDQLATVDAIVRAVQKGDLPEERLDGAVLRMPGIRLRHGLVSP